MPAGRPPKIVHDRLKEGMRKDEIQNIKNSTPIFMTQDFIPPDTLTAKEIKIWNEITTMLKQMYSCYISDADRMLIETLCKSKTEYDRACKEWDKNPRMYILEDLGGFDRDGNPKQSLKLNQWYVIKRDFSKILTKAYSELGLTPMGRAKQGMASSKSKEDKERDAFLSLNDRSDD